MGAEGQAREYYCNLLGLQELPKPESLAGRGGLWLDGGAIQVHVGVEEGVDRSASKAHVAWEVADLAAIRSMLDDSGYDVIDGIPIPGMTRLESRDPFGNRIEFLQMTD